MRSPIIRVPHVSAPHLVGDKADEIRVYFFLERNARWYSTKVRMTNLDPEITLFIRKSRNVKQLIEKLFQVLTHERAIILEFDPPHVGLKKVFDVVTVEEALAVCAENLPTPFED